VTGRVYFEDDFPQPERRRINIDADTCGLRVESERFVVEPDSKGLANAVLMIEGVSEGKPFSLAHETIEQVKCRYTPHVMIMRSGEDLNIENKDPILHNVHAYRGKDSLFNLAQPKEGQVTSKTMQRDGLVKLKCDVHPWMSAYVVVVSNPYIAITGADGSFSISDVPPGEYTITLWHEALGTSSKQVQVEPGKSSDIDFTIGG
jgi:plastocyanin